MSDLVGNPEVGNPEDRFSRVEAHILNRVVMLKTHSSVIIFYKQMSFLFVLKCLLHLRQVTIYEFATSLHSVFI